MVIAFTGPVQSGNCKERIKAGLEWAVEPLQSELVFRTGCAHGVDTVAPALAAMLHPAASFDLVVPDAPSNFDALYAGLNRSNRDVRVVRTPPVRGSTSHAYLARNRLLVRDADLLLAFPATFRELHRSGSWATVRYARERDIEIVVFPLDGSPHWVENDKSPEQRPGL